MCACNGIDWNHSRMRVWKENKMSYVPCVESGSLTPIPVHVPSLTQHFCPETTVLPTPAKTTAVKRCWEVWKLLIQVEIYVLR